MEVIFSLFFLTGSSINSLTLKGLIKDIIKKFIELGFNLVALVCDKGFNYYLA